MSTDTEILARLDFNPEVEESDDEPLRECQVRLTLESTCTNVGDWIGTLRCCTASFYCCSHHKKTGERRGWRCPKCKKGREHKWVKWSGGDA